MPSYETSETPALAAVARVPFRAGPRVVWRFWFAGGMALLFAWPLFQLARFALDNDLYSHVLIVPWVSVYLCWAGRKALPSRSAPPKGLVLAFLFLGVGLASCYWAQIFFPAQPVVEPRPGLALIGFWCCTVGGVGLFWGKAILRAWVFPLAFLLFLLPLPLGFETRLVGLLQHRSADVLEFFFSLAGTPVLRTGTEFQVPGIAPFRVAPECSGIHSTLILLLTGFFAGHCLLRRIWTRGVLVVGVVGLGVLRNAFRIFALAELSRRINPQIMDSDLHHRGGPVFFLVALVPFLLLLWALRRLEHPPAKTVA